VSVIAGFVEAGESPDRAVAREVGEEVAIGIEDPRYVGTQPWPFPRSQMMGYVARTREEAPVPAPDGAEIEWAGFYSRQELADAMGSGRLLVPRGSSIAYAMLRQWYGGELPLPAHA
ncbi:MAG: NUDIX domain-containing protein, partial [Schaalia georgiae]|nr:NUDIX domain-containing protein [Schaalia georgiae]